MPDDRSDFLIRAANDGDLHGFVELLNAIVRIGGTTAADNAGR